MNKVDQHQPWTRIYPGTVVQPPCAIDDFVIIGYPPTKGAVPTQIAANAVVRSHTVIYAGNRIGSGFHAGHGALIRESNVIGDEVSIGSHAIVEHHVTIGNRVRIHSNAFIPEYSILEDDVWIGPQATLTNARYPHTPTTKANLKGPHVKSGAVIGACAVILPGLSIGRNALIGAGAVVVKGVADHEVVVGNPARISNTIAAIPEYGPRVMSAYKKIPLVDLKAQYAAIKSEIDAAIQGVLDRTSFILGKDVADFEVAFADYLHVKGTVGVSSGTSALMLALKACGVGPGAEVITTAHTFMATAEAIFQLGAKPVFVDIDPTTYTIDPERIAAAITERTKAIVPVHLYGQPASMASIMSIARSHRLYVIEDAAQAHGAQYEGRQCGGLGDLGCFSFYPGKNLGAYGDAGAVTGNDEDLLARVRRLRDHGRTSKYTHEEIGFGERLDALQAAVLTVKLRHLDAWTEARRRTAAAYWEQLCETNVVLPRTGEAARHVYHLFVVQSDDRDRVVAELNRSGVEAGIHYPIPLHRQPACLREGYGDISLPVTEKVASRVLSLPIYPEITKPQVDRVAATLRGVVGS